MQVAFYVYNPGPTPSARAMYLVLATEELSPDAVEVELFQFLPDSREDPLAGTFGVASAALGGQPTMSGSVVVWLDSSLRQLLPAGAADSVTLTAVTPDRVTGTLRIELHPGAGSSAGSVMALRGSFTADRVTRFEDLPRMNR